MINSCYTVTSRRKRHDLLYYYICIYAGKRDGRVLKVLFFSKRWVLRYLRRGVLMWERNVHKNELKLLCDDIAHEIHIALGTYEKYGK